MVLAVTVTLTLSVGLVIVGFRVVTTVIVIRLVVVTPITMVMVIAGRGLELSVSQMGRDIHTNIITEAVTKTATITLPQAVVQGREDHEGFTGGDI